MDSRRGTEQDGRWTIRPGRDSDVGAIAAIFTAAVHELTADHYDAAQREAWAPRPPDLDAWALRLATLHTLVAEDEGCGIVGFIGYATDGHVDLLFVAPSHARRGVVRMLHERVEAALREAGVTELFTEASLVARPFFERQGYRMTEEQEVVLRGVTFRRFAMRKRPDAP